MSWKHRDKAINPAIKMQLFYVFGLSTLPGPRSNTTWRLYPDRLIIVGWKPFLKWRLVYNTILRKQIQGVGHWTEHKMKILKNHTLRLQGYMCKSLSIYHKYKRKRGSVPQYPPIVFQDITRNLPRRSFSCRNLFTKVAVFAGRRYLIIMQHVSDEQEIQTGIISWIIPGLAASISYGAPPECSRTRSTRVKNRW